LDYIIFGIGTSASLVLIGWLLRDWGPRLRDRQPPENEILSASQLVTRLGWARFCATCGMALVIGGVIVMLVTIVVMFVAPTDRAASIAVLTVFGASGFLMLVWTGLYLREYGSIGVHRPVEKRAPEPTPAVAESVGTPAAAIEQSVVGPEAEPSFAEAAASRGGLRRFAGFLRRDAVEAPTSESPATASRVDTNLSTAVESGERVEVGGEMTPTDVVIAELEGAGHDPDDKKLSETDPLVTTVRADLAASVEDGPDAQAGPDPATDIVTSSSDAADGDVEEVTEGSSGDASEATPTVEPGCDETELEPPEESPPPGDRPDHELALDSLRKRRLERLANMSDSE
jgi:hypothetical protein